ncbi:hypothetical protein [Gelidibacter salicanalis]|uniref:Uncharacterized protein n=1 Tax=Gelidibacter salicanalis TaxID=291193 RepID=A0A934KL32_9FLAO|nr:hypothetical protein [Gelidibacter salicanalis]MBJ7879204.1 hypothetical protein [Gelidibacter salicanalis]
MIKLVSKYLTDSLSEKEEMDLALLIKQKAYGVMFKKYIVDDYCVNLLWREIDVDKAFQELRKAIQVQEELMIRSKKLDLQPKFMASRHKRKKIY